MADLPSGTVTFLFTDIEGSTRLWEEDPDAMRSALALHDAVVHGAIAECGGHLVKSTGDGAFAAFERPHDAVQAAVAAQIALAEAEWPAPVVLRARIGMHSGQATEQDGDYFGPDVNRAARIMSAAHGGQIVCSAVVGEQVRDRFALVDLGEHRLRDLQSPVHLVQVDVPGPVSVFPPLRSLDAYRSNLPYELSSFVGREDEIHAVAELVRGSRVVSIVGVGGVGKTRLGLQVGSELLPEHADGVWLCELASVVESADLPGAIAAALGYTPPQGVSIVDGLSRYLERKEMLLLVDNCEHLVSTVASFVTSATARAPRVSVLVTSREALGVPGERTFPLRSLRVSEARDGVSVLASEAGALFVARAVEARGDLAMDAANAAAVHDLCARLDGIPLAIELAAAQTKVMTPAEILTRLDKQFRLLAGGRRTSLERHQTLRAAIDWSYDLLTDDERALLDRLSVCVGGFDLDAAAAIAAGVGLDEFTAFETLAALVSKSLVERNERDGVTRYRLLEMIRQYAAERLNASGAAESARDDHARHYLACATRLFEEVATPRDFDALDRLEMETANIAAAGWWLLNRDRIEQLMAFFEGLPFVDQWAVAPTTVDELGAFAGEALTRDRASTMRGFPYACYWAAVRGWFNGDLNKFQDMCELAALFPGADSYTQTLIGSSTMALMVGDIDRYEALANQAIEAARDSGDAALLAFTLAYAGGNTAAVGDPARALPLAEDALAVARTVGGSVALLFALQAVCGAAVVIDPDRSLEAGTEAMRLDRTRRRTWANSCEGNAARSQLARGDVVDGLMIWQKVLRRSEENDERIFLANGIGLAADGLAQIDPAVAIDFAAIAESNAISPVAIFAVRPALARLAAEQPDEVAAARQRAATLSYDNAIVHVLADIERLIANHRADTTGTAT